MPAHRKLKRPAADRDDFAARIVPEVVPAPVAYQPAPFEVPDHWPKNVRWVTPQQIEAARNHPTRFPTLADQPGRGGCTDRLMK